MGQAEVDLARAPAKTLLWPAAPAQSLLRLERMRTVRAGSIQALPLAE
jgi:hypothetical protein